MKSNNWLKVKHFIGCKLYLKCNANFFPLVNEKIKIINQAEYFLLEVINSKKHFDSLEYYYTTTGTILKLELNKQIHMLIRAESDIENISIVEDSIRENNKKTL